MALQEIASGVYYNPSFRGINLGLIVTDEGSVLIDTPMLPSVAAQWREQVERFGPIQYIVNSDHLQEHVMGNAFFPGDVIAHDETRGRMRLTDKAKEQYRKFVLDNEDDPAAVEPQMDRYDLRFPNVTLFDRLTVYLGGREIEVIHLPGHASNSVGVFLPDVRVLFSGDTVVNNYRPYMGLSTISEWLMTLRAIEVMELDWIVPGHGEPMRNDELAPLATYLETMRARVDELIESGRARDEIVSKMMPYFEEWPVDNTRRDEERNLFRQGVRQLYDQLTGRR